MSRDPGKAVLPEGLPITSLAPLLPTSVAALLFASVAALLFASVAVLALPTAVRAQDTGPVPDPTEPRWLADARYVRDAFTGDSPIWTDWWAVHASLYRQFDRGSLGIQGAIEERFEQTDRSVAVDAYRDLWNGAYANLRLRVAPDADVLPRSDYRGEIFQAFAGPWEGSAHVWFMNSAGPNVTLGGVGLARYAGPWYVRTVGSIASTGGKETGSFRISARRYMGTSRQYVELTGGVGGEVVTVGPGPDLQVRDTWFAQITAQRYFWVLGRPATDPEIGSERLVGVQVSGGLHEFEDIPRRRRLSIGVIAAF